MKKYLLQGVIGAVVGALLVVAIMFAVDRNSNTVGSGTGFYNGVVMASGAQIASVTTTNLVATNVSMSACTGVGCGKVNAIQYFSADVDVVGGTTGTIVPAIEGKRFVPVVISCSLVADTDLDGSWDIDVGSYVNCVGVPINKTLVQYLVNEDSPITTPASTTIDYVLDTPDTGEEASGTCTIVVGGYYL